MANQNPITFEAGGPDHWRDSLALHLLVNEILAHAVGKYLLHPNSFDHIKSKLSACKQAIDALEPGGSIGGGVSCPAGWREEDGICHPE